MIFIFHQFPNLKKIRSSITLVLHLYEVGCREQKWVSTFYRAIKVRDDPKQMGDSGEVPIPEWIGWRFDSRCGIFSLLDGGKKLIK
jgi:hypothetical protein